MSTKGIPPSRAFAAFGTALNWLLEEAGLATSFSLTAGDICARASLGGGN